MGRPVPLAAAYTADRAAALAGVPRSTLYYWARKELLTPSVSDIKVKRWSYADLLALRLIEWLRRDKPDMELPRTPIRKIRDALLAVGQLGARLDREGLDVWVDEAGRIVLGLEEKLFVPVARGLLQGMIGASTNLIAAGSDVGSIERINLVRPRPTLRIIPGKLASEPHVQDTRIPTRMLATLHTRGFETNMIRELYPELMTAEITDALDLEEHLEKNVRLSAA